MTERLEKTSTRHSSLVSLRNHLLMEVRLHYGDDDQKDVDTSNLMRTEIIRQTFYVVTSQCLK